jgi:hypothetical protein
MLRYILVIVLFVAITVLLFANPFGLSQGFRDAIVPWATLSLALVAVLTIIHSDLREERRRKLNRLQAVMEWATDVLNATQVIHPPKDFIVHGDDVGTATYERLGQIDKVNDFKRLSIQGEHIKIISTLTNKEILSTVSTVTQSIDDLLREDWSTFDIIGFRDWIAEHEGRIYQNTRLLIAECTRQLKGL